MSDMIRSLPPLLPCVAQGTVLGSKKRRGLPLPLCSAPPLQLLPKGHRAFQQLAAWRRRQLIPWQRCTQKCMLPRRRPLR